MDVRNCEQEKCYYYQSPGCPVCDNCGQQPNQVDDDCYRCWNCKNDINLLRGTAKEELENVQTNMGKGSN